MKEERASVLGKSFLTLDLVIGGKKLRRVTAGSVLVLQELGNALFAFEEEAEAGEDEQVPTKGEELDSLLDLCGFIWVHTADLDEVIATVEDGEEGVKRYRKECRKLSMELEEGELTQFAGEFAKLNERIRAAGTGTCQEEGGEPGKPVPSRTGSQATSSASAAPVTRSESDTSSGSSPSSEGCSSSTRGSGTTGPAATGPCPGSEAENPKEILLPSLPGAERNGSES